MTDQPGSDDRQEAPPAPPHSLALALPACYLDDDLAQGLVAALDQLLLPVFMVLDSLDVFLDPRRTPGDFLPWLAGWVGLELERLPEPDEARPELEERRRVLDHHQRVLVAEAVRLYRRRGTVGGLRMLISLSTGVREDDIEIFESGGIRSSPEGQAEPPGVREPYLRVRVWAPEGIDAARLDEVVDMAKPAHLPHEVEVIP